MITVTCDECGKDLNVFPSRYKRYKKHFCNRKCYKKYHSKTPFRHPRHPCTTYVDGAGRARVHCPGHERSDKYGYVLRSIVHWEYYNNKVVPKGYDVHHKDKNRLNDTKENLEVIEHSEHSKLHHPIKETTCTCKFCGKDFQIKTWRLKDKSRGQYCSQKCFKQWRKKNAKQK